MGARPTAPRSSGPEQVISCETRIGRTDPAGRHRLAVTPDTDKGRAWYIPTARVTPTPARVTACQPQPAPPADPRHMRARSRGSRNDTDRGRAWYIPTAPVTTHTVELTLRRVVSGTYPRPQSQAVRLILGLYLETRLIRQARAGRMARARKNSSREPSTRNTVVRWSDPTS